LGLGANGSADPPKAQGSQGSLGLLYIGKGWSYASAKPFPSSVVAAHAAFVATLSGHPPRPIPVDADAIDLEDRADHLNKVLSALSVYVTVILDGTAQNVPSAPDLPDIEAVLADLASDLTGSIQHADDMAGRVAWVSSSNPPTAVHSSDGSDGRIMMGDDEAALLRLWQEKRGEAEPEDLSGNLIVQLGLATEGLNRLPHEDAVRTQYHKIRDRDPVAKLDRDVRRPKLYPKSNRPNAIDKATRLSWSNRSRSSWTALGPTTILKDRPAGAAER
jgi:hypothetical protein